jgi:hypothetical protein
VEEFAAEGLWKIAEETPPEWYGGDPGVIEHLMEILLGRRVRVRELIGQFRESNREPFPNWGRVKRVVVAGSFEAAVEAGRLVM